MGARGRCAVRLLPLALIVVAGALLGASPAAAQETRVAFINSEQIIEKYPGTQSIEAQFSADVDSWNKDLQARKRELTRLERELTSQGPMLSEEKLREKEQEYQAKVAQYDNFVQSIWGPGGLIVERNEELLRPIIDRVQTILSTIGAEEGYGLILDAADGNILYADPDLDLTERVLAELQAQDAESQ